MNTPRITLLLAILLAIGTGALTLIWLNQVRQQTTAGNEPRQVVVAVKPIPARTTITPDMIAIETRPQSAVDSDAFDKTDAVAGQLSLITIPQGSQVTASKVGHPRDVGLPVVLKPGTRAVSIWIDKVKGISGLLEPGDRVDVLAIPPRQGDAVPAAVAILRGIRVLAIGNMMETTSATPDPQYQNFTTVTLEVTPQQANLLATADQNATLRLALRSPREPLNSLPTQSLSFIQSTSATVPAPAPQSPIATAMAPVAAPAPAPAPPRAAAPAQPRTSNIMIIDGDRITYSTAGSEQP